MATASPREALAISPEPPILCTCKRIGKGSSLCFAHGKGSFNLWGRVKMAARKTIEEVAERMRYVSIDIFHDGVLCFNYIEHIRRTS